MYKKAFTLIEMLTVLAIITLLASLLLPVLRTDRARMLSCLSNERQLGLGILLYATDYEGALPLYAEHLDGTGAWWEVLPAYLRDRGIFRCPSTVASWGIDYSVNYLHVIQYPPGMPWVTPETTGPAMLDRFAHPAGTLVLADGLVGALYDPRYWTPDGAAYRHSQTANALFLDGHVASVHGIRDEWWGR